MGSYFRGWKRRAGVMTLVLSCLFTAGWVRSGYKVDILSTRIQNTYCTVGSIQGSFSLAQTINHESSNNHPPLYWFSIDRADAPSADMWMGYSSVRRINFAGLELGVGNPDSNPAAKSFVATMPYWVIVIPMTIVSAWLLLSKRRQPVQPEPLQETAA